MNCPYCGKRIVRNTYRLDRSHSARFRWRDICERKGAGEANLYIHMGWACEVTRREQKWRDSTGYGIGCSVCGKWYSLYRIENSLAAHIMATKDMPRVEHALCYLLAEDH